jgi:hypothetical protein
MSVKLQAWDDQEWNFTISDCASSVAVVEAVAHVTGQDMRDIEPLADEIDPDAIDRLLSRGDDVTISFVLEETNVQVSGSGELVISRNAP